MFCGWHSDSLEGGKIWIQVPATLKLDVMAQTYNP